MTESVQSPVCWLIRRSLKFCVRAEVLRCCGCRRSAWRRETGSTHRSSLILLFIRPPTCIPLPIPHICPSKPQSITSSGKMDLLKALCEVSALLFEFDGVLVTSGEDDFLGPTDVDALQVLAQHCLQVFHHLSEGNYHVLQPLLPHLPLLCLLSEASLTVFLRKPVRSTDPCTSLWMPISISTLVLSLMVASSPTSDTSATLNESQLPTNPN
jgi:hypothetical protein